jgi:hypothetical protein
MKTFWNMQRAFCAVALITIAGISVTACQQDSVMSPLATMDNLSTASTTDITALTGGSSSETTSDFDPAMNILGLAGGSETRPEAIVEISRRRLSGTSTETGAEASARFDSTLGVTGVILAVLGTSYQFVRPPMRPQNGNGRPGNGGNGGNPPGGNPPPNAQRPARIASTLFIFPAPPATSATTRPALITLNDVNALATVTAVGYTFADNTVDIPGKITLISVNEGDVVSRSAALNLRWNLAGTFTNGRITVHNVADSATLAGKSRQEVAQILRNMPKPLSKELSAGTTSVEFTATELASLQSGMAEISVGVVNTKRTNSDKAVLIAHSRSGIRVRLQ